MPPPPPAPDEFKVSLRAWNLAGGMDWDGLDVAIDLLGIKDIEALLFDLQIIRDHA